ncbi:hypothetical protein SALCHL_001651 [Streptomyces albus subsp. chlorinus]|uniref:hypothetical protein n=1 Tax=Streptomyces albus TaxID=1888 RepID=UPI003D0ED65A
MGWTVLYIAFGVVALWLLGEVLLQYKAHLRWRLLAFAGFLGVVVGTAVLPSVVVIGLGIAAFAVGQTFVTLSVRSGFTGGWSLGGGPGSSRRRRTGGDPGDKAPGHGTPSLEVTDLQAGGPDTTPTPVAVPVPDPVDDYGQAGYGQSAPEHLPGQEHLPGPDHPGPQEQPPAAAPPGYGSYAGYESYEEEPSVFGQAPDETQVYAYGTGGGPYDSAPGGDPYAQPGYDAYAGHPGYGEQPQPAEHAPHGLPSGHQGPPAYQEYPDPYAGYGDQGTPHTGYGYPAAQPPEQPPYYPDLPETPPGGVWVPQQRDATGPLPPSGPPSPYGYGDPGYGAHGDPGYGAHGDLTAHDGTALPGQDDPGQQPHEQPRYPQGYYGGQY